jgi:hypothetical protein
MQRARARAQHTETAGLRAVQVVDKVVLLSNE